MSPLHMVPKNRQETKFLLITVLCCLNNFVEPENFATPSEVMTQIKPSSRYFIVSDLASGYHQIKISSYDQIFWISAQGQVV